MRPDMGGTRGRLALAAGLVVALGVLLPACGPDKSYSFPKVVIDATVNQDGSLSIVEERTFDFHGEYHFAFFTVEHQTFDDVVEFTVSEDGVPFDPGLPQGTTGALLIEDNVLEGPGGFKYKATWWYDAKDEQRTFTFSYRVLCAAEVFADTGRLLWKFIGEGWTEETDSAVITVHLPGKATREVERPTFPCYPGSTLDEQAPIPTTPLSVDEVRAWGHGPLNGVVALPWVEGHITFPREVVPAMYSNPDPRLQKILDREAGFAEEANAARAEAIAAEAERRRWARVAYGVLIGYPVLMLLLAFVARRRDRDPDIPDILDGPPEPDAHPAVLAVRWALVNRRSPVEAYRAELLHLAQGGSIDIRPVGTVTQAKDHEVRPVEEPEDPLDEDFYGFLFGARDDTPEPVSLNRYKPKKAEARRLDAWWKKITGRAESETFGASGKGRWELRILSWIWLSGLVWSFILAAKAGRGWFAPAFIALGLVVMYVGRKLIPARLRDPERQRTMMRWRAFRRYLASFSSLPTAPAAAVIIWERYLVFAVALGVADKVEEQVRAILPESQMPKPYAGAPSGLAGYNAWRSVAASSVVSPWQARSASAYPSSSGGGGSSSSSSGFGGGGFSGGGGGGGGGTGGGAG
jgi:uncharacterized membrane protein YgcG